MFTVIFKRCVIPFFEHLTQPIITWPLKRNRRSVEEHSMKHFNLCSMCVITRPAYGEEHMARVLRMHWIINSITRCPSVIIKLNYSPSSPLEGKHTHAHGHKCTNTLIRCTTRAFIYSLSIWEPKWNYWWICLSHAKWIMARRRRAANTHHLCVACLHTLSQYLHGSLSFLIGTLVSLWSVAVGSGWK